MTARHGGRPAGTGGPAAAGRPGRGPQAVAGPAALVATGIVSVQVGAGLATRLFHQLPPAAVTGLRLWSAALVLLIVGGRGARGAVAGLAERRAWRDAATALSFGICLGGHEFRLLPGHRAGAAGRGGDHRVPGPAGGRRGGFPPAARPALGGAGGHRRGPAHRGRDGPPEHLRGHLRRASAVGWAAYIIFSAATGRRFTGSSGLVIAMLIAAVVVTPGALATANSSLRRPSVLATGAGVGAAVLGAPLRSRAAGAAAAVDPGVRHLDEPGAGGGGADRAGAAGPAPVGQRMGRRRLRRHRLRRRRPLRSPGLRSPGLRSPGLRSPGLRSPGSAPPGPAPPGPAAAPAPARAPASRPPAPS